MPPLGVWSLQQHVMQRKLRYFSEADFIQRQLYLKPCEKQKFDVATSTTALAIATVYNCICKQQRPVVRNRALLLALPWARGQSVFAFAVQQH